MKSIPLTEETATVATRIIWFEPPGKALSDPVRFMAYAMTYAMHEEMRVLRRYVSDDDFREALDRAPPGIIDARSWAYWNSKMGRYPPPPLPMRRFESGNPDLVRKLSLEEIRRRARHATRSNPLQLPRADRQGPQAHAGGRKYRIAEGGGNQGHGRFADAAGRLVAVHQMHIEFG